jgi:hypothetical protein
VIAPALGFAGVKGGVQADSHERILKECSRSGVSVDIAGGHARELEPVRQAFQAPVAGAVALKKRPLEFDPQPVHSKGLPKEAQRGLIVDTPQSASAEADESPSVIKDHVQRDVGISGRSGLLTRVRVSAGQDAAQVGPPMGVLHQQSEMTSIIEIDLGPMDRPQAECPGRDGELHRP